MNNYGITRKHKSEKSPETSDTGLFLWIYPVYIDALSLWTCHLSWQLTCSLLSQEFWISCFSSQHCINRAETTYQVNIYGGEYDAERDPVLSLLVYKQSRNIDENNTLVFISCELPTDWVTWESITKQFIVKFNNFYLRLRNPSSQQISQLGTMLFF